MEESKEMQTIDELTRDNAKTLLMLLVNACGVETEDQDKTIDLIAYNSKKLIESQTKELQEENELQNKALKVKRGENEKLRRGNQKLNIELLSMIEQNKALSKHKEHD